MVLFLSVSEEGKCDIDYKKMKIFFSPLGSFLINFGG